MQGNATICTAVDHDDPIDAIKQTMQERGLEPRDLIPMIGSRSNVHEILSRKRPLTMPMARALHQQLGIKAETLLKAPQTTRDNAPSETEWGKFPVNEMAKRGWIAKSSSLRADAPVLIKDLMNRAGECEHSDALYRKTDQNRANAKTDPYALKAWCWQVLAQANCKPPQAEPPHGVEPIEKIMKQAIRLSPAIEGPKKAKEFLESNGIAVEVVRHLPRTHIDGAAMMSPFGYPVIGLTLRYDRIDNFWFVLMHEMAHVARHLGSDPRSTARFVEDLNIASDAAAEREADEMASECLIPQRAWQESNIETSPSPMKTIALAQATGVHPAIIAGRVRYEAQNYRLLSQFVGTGEVRRLLCT